MSASGSAVVLEDRQRRGRRRGEGDAATGYGRVQAQGPAGSATS